MGLVLGDLGDIERQGVLLINKVSIGCVEQVIGVQTAMPMGLILGDIERQGVLLKRG